MASHADGEGPSKRLPYAGRAHIPLIGSWVQAVHALSSLLHLSLTTTLLRAILEPSFREKTILTAEHLYATSEMGGSGLPFHAAFLANRLQSRHAQLLSLLRLHGLQHVGHAQLLQHKPVARLIKAYLSVDKRLLKRHAARSSRFDPPSHTPSLTPLTKRDESPVPAHPIYANLIPPSLLPATTSGVSDEVRRWMAPQLQLAPSTPVPTFAFLGFAPSCINPTPTGLAYQMVASQMTPMATPGIGHLSPGSMLVAPGRSH